MSDFSKIPDYYIGGLYGYEAMKVVSDFELGYNLGTATTYLLRAGKKVYVNDSEQDSFEADILKAINHLKAELEDFRLKNK